MRCFNHHDRDAFGICTVCGKGLCLECMNKINDVITCGSNKCNNKLRQIKIWQTMLFLIFILAIVLVIID